MKDHSANTKKQRKYLRCQSVITYAHMRRDGRHLCGWNGVSFEPGGIATCTVMVNGVDKYGNIAPCAPCFMNSRIY